MESKTPDNKSLEQHEQEVSIRYKQLQQETQVIIQKMMELEDEKRDNQLVMQTMGDVEDSRKCWRMVNGVLFEKTKADIIPELEVAIKNNDVVTKQLGDSLTQRKQEIMKLEQ